MGENHEPDPFAVTRLLGVLSDNRLPLLVGSLYGLSAGYVGAAVMIHASGIPLFQFMSLEVELAVVGVLSHVLAMCLTAVWLWNASERYPDPYGSLDLERGGESP